jgi:hypothetical protein
MEFLPICFSESVALIRQERLVIIAGDILGLQDEETAPGYEE